MKKFIAAVAALAASMSAFASDYTNYDPAYNGEVIYVELGDEFTAWTNKGIINKEGFEGGAYLFQQYRHSSVTVEKSADKVVITERGRLSDNFYPLESIYENIAAKLEITTTYMVASNGGLAVTINLDLKQPEGHGDSQKWHNLVNLTLKNATDLTDTGAYAMVKHTMDDAYTILDQVTSAAGTTGITYSVTYAVDFNMNSEDIPFPCPSVQTLISAQQAVDPYMGAADASDFMFTAVQNAEAQGCDYTASQVQQMNSYINTLGQ